MENIYLYYKQQYVDSFFIILECVQFDSDFHLNYFLIKVIIRKGKFLVNDLTIFLPCRIKLKFSPVIFMHQMLFLKLIYWLSLTSYNG